MKKILLILIFGLLWCNVGNAGMYEPGQDQKCRKLIEKEKFFEKEVLKKVSFVKSQGHAIVVFYFSCNAKYNDWGYNHTSGQILIQDDGQPLRNKNVHYSAYDRCMVNAKKYTQQDCFLYSIDDVVVWGKDAVFVEKVENEIYKKMDPSFALKEKRPISPESISEWDYTCDKEDFKKYVATVEGCIGIKALGKIDKSKKKLVVFLHGDYKGTKPHDPKRYSGFSKVIKDQKENINFFFIARPGHQFPGRKRSAGKWKNYESINQNPDRVVWKKGWGSIKLISQTIYRLKEFYQPEQLIAIGMSGGAQDISVMSGKVPGLIDVGILGGCDCFTTSRPFWIPREFIKTIPRDMPIIMISGEKDDYLERAKNYYAIAKREGLNVELHIVKGGHDARKTLIAYGKDIIKEVLKQAEKIVNLTGSTCKLTSEETYQFNVGGVCIFTYYNPWKLTKNSRLQGGI